MLWIIFAGLTLLALAFLLLPLLRAGERAASRSTFGLNVYRNQLDNLAEERARGALTEAEEAAARVEIERRMLRTADEKDKGSQGASGGGRGAVVSAALIAVLVPAAAMLIYARLGNPGLPDRPLAERNLIAESGGSADEAEVGNLRDMASRLAERLEKEPDDFEGWILLGQTYFQLRRFSDAAMAYRHALDIRQDDGALHMALAESLVFGGEGQVTPEAERHFRQVRALLPDHPGPRYYLALARAQGGDLAGAYTDWLAFYRDSPADAPWLDTLRRRLSAVAAELGEALPDDVRTAAAPAPALPGPTQQDMAAAADMTPEDRAEMIRGMVGRLAERMDEAPTADGLARLARAYRVLGDEAKAVEAEQRLAALGGGTSAPVSAPSPAATPIPGPTQQDMAAAADMTPEDRQAMIQGMVGRLADRMAEAPTADGLARLARAYRVLGDETKAAEAEQRLAALSGGAPAAAPAPSGSDPAVEDMLSRARAIIDKASADGPMPGEAAALYRKVLARDPNNPEALWYVALSDTSAGRYADAVAGLERLLGLMPEGAAQRATVEKVLEDVRARL
ncbi:c-type cytochrome biogenesis protein CcmI [Oceanibacterium hippocampi]|nr:c-type cytochrome biogenesis protein CcmI [Oceanibacterium hippocampi]